MRHAGFDFIDEAENSRGVVCEDREESPYSQSFATRIASSKSFTRKTDKTGPNTSSRAIRMSGVTLSKTAGWTK